MMRKRIYQIIERSDGDRISTIYDAAMVAIVLLSLVPLCFKTETDVLAWINQGTVAVFILDYLLRWATADYKLGRGRLSFLIYPFTFMAVVDLLAILPAFGALGQSFRLFKLLRLSRLLRVLRALKLLRYSRSLEIILGVIRKQATPLLAVGTLAVSYILVSALVVFNVEPDIFDNFFEAVYWATVSLTTVGYGDIYPVTTAGRIITMASSVIGIAVVALPAGIITAGYMAELQKEREEDEIKKTGPGSDVQPQ